MQHSSKVSIIIPAYNAERFIERSVSCALAQTYENVEVVVVDDGSADATPAIAQRLAEADARVKCTFHETNRGRLEARRTGIEAATGNFVLFLDADDEIAPDMAERLLQAREDRFDIVQCDFELAYKRYVSPSEMRFNRDFNRPPAARAFGDDVTHLVFRDRRTTWSLCGKLMRTSHLKEAFSHIPPSSITQAEDACVFFMVSCLAQSYRGMPSYTGYRYNIDEGSSDARWKTMDLAQFDYSCRYVESMDRIRAFLEETGRMQALRDDYLTVRREHARSVADKLLHTVDRPLRPAAFDQFTSMWPADEAVAGLAEAGWDDAAGSLESVASARALHCPAHEVRTVAAYHYNMHIGGAERVVAELAAVWARMGLRVVIFADEPREMCAYDLPENTEWVELPAAAGMQPEGYAERARVLARAVRDMGVDAFVHHQWWNPLLSWDALLLKTLGVPVCLICHNIYEVLFFEANAAEFDCSRVFRHLDGLVTLSEADRRFWKKFNPRVWRTDNPVTIAPDPARRSALAGKNVVWVGRLSYCDKQPQEAIEIIARVAAFDPEVTLTLVGPAADDRMLRDLKDLVKRLRVQDNVVFAGPSGDPSPYYRDAAVHLLTSRLDGWCLVLAESKAHGLPCVMYEMDYLTLTQGSRGIVAVPQYDREAAARAIAELLANADRRRELGNEAFEHIGEIAGFNFEALWGDVFAALAEGSPDRAGFEEADAEWDLLLDGLHESLRKAASPGVADYARRKGVALAKRAYHRIVPR